jgi:hypothetical protein
MVARHRHHNFCRLKGELQGQVPQLQRSPSTLSEYSPRLNGHSTPTQFRTYSSQTDQEAVFDDDDDEHDGEASVAGTEGTSLGSLTSVE